MIENIEKAIDLVGERNQYNTPNLLTDEIQQALIINQDQAMETAKGICKVLTFWIEGSAKDLIDMSFNDFYKYCIDNKYISRSEKNNLFTWVALPFNDKEFDFAEKFDIEINSISSYDKFVNYKKKDEFLGTLRIISNGGGLHSLIAFRNSGGKLRIADTSKRGIDVDLYKYITEDNFKYFTEMII